MHQLALPTTKVPVTRALIQAEREKRPADPKTDVADLIHVAVVGVEAGAKAIREEISPGI